MNPQNPVPSPDFTQASPTPPQLNFGNENNFINKKSIISLLLIGILLLVIPVSTQMLKESQIFKSKAAGEIISFGGSNVTQVDGQDIALDKTIDVILDSPFGSAGSSGGGGGNGDNEGGNGDNGGGGGGGGGGEDSGGSPDGNITCDPSSCETTENTISINASWTGWQECADSGVQQPCSYVGADICVQSGSEAPKLVGSQGNPDPRPPEGIFPNGQFTNPVSINWIVKDTTYTFSLYEDGYTCTDMTCMEDTTPGAAGGYLERACKGRLVKSITVKGI